MIPATHPDIIGPTSLERPETLTPVANSRHRGRSGPNLAPMVKASKLLRVLYECERCGCFTYLPLDGKGECSKCQTREPDVTLDEIAAECAAIRAGWSSSEWKSQPGAPQPWTVPGSKFDERKR